MSITLYLEVCLVMIHGPILSATVVQDVKTPKQLKICEKGLENVNLSSFGRNHKLPGLN